MPVPVPPPSSAPSRQRGFHLPGHQPYARDHERRSHTEAIFAFGEYAMFVLLWNIEDLNAGRVTRCSRCQSLAGETDEASEMIFETFKATAEDFCPNCLGTTFEGGWKAKIVRPSLWDYQEEVWSKTARGLVQNLSGSVQTTSDFLLRDGDVILRADGTRWRTKAGQPSRIHEGFGLPPRADSNLGYTYAQVNRDEDTTLKIEPTTRTELTSILSALGQHWPTDTSGVDQIRGPILPEMHEYVPQDYRPVDDLPGSPTMQP